MDELARRVEEQIMQRLAQKPRALLIGRRPSADLPYALVEEAPYVAVIIGSLTTHELLFPPNEIFDALLNGVPVLLDREGLPHAHCSAAAPRSLLLRLREAEQLLCRWGVQPICSSGAGKLITASTARQMIAFGQSAPPGSRLTPLAREILEGKEP